MNRSVKAIVLCFLICFSITACGGPQTANNSPDISPTNSNVDAVNANTDKPTSIEADDNSVDKPEDRVDECALVTAEEIEKITSQTVLSTKAKGNIYCIFELKNRDQYVATPTISISLYFSKNGRPPYILNTEKDERVDGLGDEADIQYGSRLRVRIGTDILMVESSFLTDLMKWEEVFSSYKEIAKIALKRL